jgi:hypothetical protein
MSEIEQVKQAAAAAVTTVKADAVKLVDVTEECGAYIGQEAVAARQKTLAALNREESWIETHPKQVGWILVGLFVLILAVLAKSCHG